MKMLATLPLLVACAASPPPVSPPPAVGITMAERYDDKLGAALAKRWRAGELHAREVSTFTIEGALDGTARSLVTTLGGHVTGRASTVDTSSPLVVDLPNEALPFLLPQRWLTRVEIDPGSRARPWSATPIDFALVAPELQNKLGTYLRADLDSGTRNYTFSGALTTEGCLDDARRAELLANAVDTGYMRPVDAACTQSIVSFIAPGDVVLRIAALPWVIAIVSEPPSEPTSVR